MPIHAISRHIYKTEKVHKRLLYFFTKSSQLKNNIYLSFFKCVNSKRYFTESNSKEEMQLKFMVTKK